jgi:hypothetical protein
MHKWSEIHALYSTSNVLPFTFIFQLQLEEEKKSELFGC